jgi:predicted hydrocarbon binding protein
LKGEKHRIFPVHYDPGKKLFQVIVKLSDAPGSYSSVLDLIRTKVNLIGTTTYTLSDGTAIFSGFAEALSPQETAKGIRELILQSNAAIDADVREGTDGLLIDTFHTGFAVDTAEYMLLVREGLAHVFNHVSRLLGSGGEALLFDEGLTMGLWNAETLVKRFGSERTKNQSAALTNFMTAQGWGETEGKLGPKKGELVVAVADCFECSMKGSPRKGCNFMRGYFAGAAKAIFGHNYESTETKCCLKGAKTCEFLLTRRD